MGVGWIRLERFDHVYDAFEDMVHVSVDERSTTLKVILTG